MMIIFAFIIEFSSTGSGTGNILEQHPGFLYSPIIILAWVFGKKLTSSMYDTKVEHTCLTFQRYWYSKRGYFKKPFPIGLLVPFVLSFLSLGYLKVPLLLQTEVTDVPKKRLLKRKGSYKKSEINEKNIAFSVVWGFWFLIFLSILALIFKQPSLAKYSIMYGFWNLIPIGQIDGNKLFFGSFPNWVILVIAYIISLVVILL